MAELIVTDTSPLIGLERIGQLELLPRLFDRVLAPPSVAAEFGACPAWLEVVEVPVSEQRRRLRAQLDLGEADAIALAITQAGASLLIDERRGRGVAEALGLRIVGTLGLLLLAKQAGQLVSVRPLLEALRAQGFHLSERVYQRVLQLAGE